jgi:predicted dehydrogenase
MIDMPSSERQPACPNDGFSRRDFLLGSVATVAVAGGGLGAFYFGYDKAVGRPVRVGVLGAGDEGSVLIGALNPEFVEVKSIADIRPYNEWRAFHGDHSSETALEARPGLMQKFGWKTEDQAKKHVKVYRAYQDLLDNARADGLEGVIVALPLHLHAPAAVAAMQAGLHVLTEKLMAHSVHECKEMGRVAAQKNLLLAVGHQRHYNILYANAMDFIRRGRLGEVHYIRGQWHRGNLPGKDSWQQPLPHDAKPKDKQAKKLQVDLVKSQKELEKAEGREIDVWRLRVAQIKAQIEDGDKEKLDAAKFGYEKYEIKDKQGKVLYTAPPIEELIRWRLFDRTSAGLMAELGSHQLDAAGLFVAAQHDGVKQHPLSVVASAARPLFPPDRDVEDHVYCIIDFPAPGYDPKDPLKERKKIGVQYASINGNGFGGYGEIVYGTEGTIIIEREQEWGYYPGESSAGSKVTASQGQAAALDTQASGPVATVAAAGSAEKVSRGYKEEIEHWAWCLRHRDPANQPRCNPKVALGDAVIALVANRSAHSGMRIDFQEEWFDIDKDETPENVKPDVGRYTT